MGAIFGYVSARFLAKEQPRQARTVSFETGIQNSPLTLALVQVAFTVSEEFVRNNLQGENAVPMMNLCKHLCNTGTKFGCGSGIEGSQACHEWLNDMTFKISGDEESTYTCSDLDGVDGDGDEISLDIVAPFCSKLFCYNMYPTSQMESYATILSDPLGLGSTCSDPRAQVIPLLYGFYICVLSPFFLLFFVFVLGTRHEDPLWQEIPEHKWLWEMDYQTAIDCTLIDRLTKTIEKYPNCRAVGNKNSGTTKGPWTFLSYKQYLDEILFLGRFFIDMGGDRAAPVCILSFNRPEWFISDMACMFAGFIPAGIYPTATSADVKYIVVHSEAQFICCENQRQLEKIRTIRNSLVHVKEIVVFEDKDTRVSLDKLGMRATAAEEEKARDAAEQEATGDSEAVIEEESEWAENFEDHVHYWGDIRKKYFVKDRLKKEFVRPGAKHSGKRRRGVGYSYTEMTTEERMDELAAESLKRRQAIKPEDVITMIYTSGTTGSPKCVMITHRNIGWCIYSISVLVHVCPEDSMVSYLPLCHIAEKVCSLYGPATFGCNVYFAASDSLRGTLVTTIRQVGPTVFFGVPRIWEKIHEKMMANRGKTPVYFLWLIPTGEWGKRQWSKLIKWAMTIGLKGAYAKQQNRPMPKRWWWANEIVFQNVKTALGLQRCRMNISAAAPLSIETAEFFMSFNIFLLEAYGMSETAGPVTFNSPHEGGWRTNSCGKPIIGVDVKIADDGELLIRGACTCRGYYKDPVETAELIDEDLFVHTGDIATMDADGFVYITDRKKHLIITAGGENVAPAPIEGSLAAMEGIGFAVVVGDLQKFLICLLTIDSVNACKFASSKYGFEDDGNFRHATQFLRDSKDYNDYLQKGINEINKKLPQVKTIKKYCILEKDFTDQGNMCELTPTQKVKHRVVKQKYYKKIRETYGAHFKESNITSQQNDVMVDKVKLHLGAWPSNRCIVSLLLTTKSGKVLIDDGTGCLPSVVMPDKSMFNVASSENIRFIWCQQLCKMTNNFPAYVPDRTHDEMNVFGMIFTYAVGALRATVDGLAAGNVYPRLLSDTYKTDLKSAIITTHQEVDDTSDVSVQNHHFKWVSLDSKPEYKPLESCRNISNKNKRLLEGGTYIAYMVTASTRSGLFIMTPKDDFSNIPCEKISDSSDVTDEDLDWVRMVRPALRKGQTVEEIEEIENEDTGKRTGFSKLFIEGFRTLRKKLGMEDKSDAEFLKCLYDHEVITIDRLFNISVIVIADPKTLTVSKLPAHLAQNYQLVSMSIYEPNHFYNYYPDIYGDMQKNILARNREASEMHWRIQQGKGKKGERARHKDEKDAIRKEARRWDCMKWHMKLVHWVSAESYPHYCNVLTDEAMERMTPKEQVLEVAHNWVDEWLEWERDAVRICTEADGWGGLQVEMEKNKFEAKFRQKKSAGPASRQSMSGSTQFRSAGASATSSASMWRSSRVGDSSFSSASNFRSSVSSSVGSSVSSSSSFASSASSVEDMKSMTSMSSMNMKSMTSMNMDDMKSMTSMNMGDMKSMNGMPIASPNSQRRQSGIIANASERSGRRQSGGGGRRGSSNRRQSGVVSDVRRLQQLKEQDERNRRISALAADTQSLTGAQTATKTAAKMEQIGDDEDV